MWRERFAQLFSNAEKNYNKTKYMKAGPPNSLIINSLVYFIISSYLLDAVVLNDSEY